MRTSSDATVKLMFTNKLSKTGNLTMAYDEPQSHVAASKSKWGAALVAEKQKGKVSVRSWALTFSTLFNVVFCIRFYSPIRPHSDSTHCRTASTRRCTKCARLPACSGPPAWSC